MTTSTSSSDNTTTSSTYLLHYGFDWASYPIGHIWGPVFSGDGTVSALGYQWLQDALTKNDDFTPALFHFKPGDSLKFKIWDLTQWTTTPTGTSLKVTGYFAMNALGGSTYKSNDDDTTVNMTNYVSFDSSSSLSWSGTDKQKYIKFEVGMSHYQNPLLSPVGIVSGYSSTDLGSLTFNVGCTDYSCIMNFCLQVQYDGNTGLFIAEPEAYIGSGKTTV